MALVGLTIYNPFNPSTHLWKLWLCLQQGLPASEKFTTEGWRINPQRVWAWLDSGS